MSVPVIQDSTVAVLIASNTVTATGNSATFSLPQGECYSLYLNVTAASGTTPNLNAVLQTSLDNGTTWVNIPVVFSSVTAAGVAGPLIFKPTLSIGAAGVAPTIAAGTAQATNAPFQRKYMRLSNTITGTTPSFTYVLYAIIVPKGFSIA